MKTKQETQSRYELMRTDLFRRSDWHKGYVKALEWMLETEEAEEP